MKFSRWILISISGASVLGLTATAIALHVPGRLKGRIKTLVSHSETPGEPIAVISNDTLPPVQKDFRVLQELYAGGLKNAWEDYGWSERTVSGPGPAVLDLSDYGGWILHHQDLPGAEYGALTFRLNAPKAYGDFLEVSLLSDVATLEPVAVGSRYRFVQDDGWVLVVVPWYELNPFKRPFNGVRIRATRRVAKDHVRLDQIVLAAPQSGPAPVREVPNREETVTIHCARPTTPISSLIYGVAGRKIAPDLGAASYRFGGNPTSRYNWSIGNIWNTASDWYFQNLNIEWNWTQLIDLSVQHKTEVTLTLPMLGWVARDASSYSFPISVFGTQQQVDPGNPDIGNGIGLNGTPLQPGNPERTSIPVPPELVGNWVKMIRAESERRGRVVHSYILDNEPGLWNSTHRDVHPEPIGYDELLDRTIRYGTAIRKADSDAIIAGPAEWGWSNYFWSGIDAKAGFFIKPDRRAHGDVPLLDWYLQKLYEHEKKTGVRVLDVVDLHFYPQGKGIFYNGGGGATDWDTVTRRIRATRSLWDPTYEDESWIKERIQLIPRLKEIIGRTYPGRGISIGEWNFGAEGHISGGLATAEALGRFAETGIRSAYYWTSPKVGSPAYWGFRAFRNFDGKGGAFLERYVASTAPKDVTVFASRDVDGTHFVIIVLALAPTNAFKLHFDTTTCGAIDSWKTLVYDGNPAGFVPSKTGSGSVISDTLPPYSITVLDFAIKS